MTNRITRLREARANDEEGFTLIELLVVVVIIGVLIAIAIPLYLNYTKGAKDKTAASDLRGAISVLEQCNADNSNYPTALGALTGNSYATLTGCTGQAINLSGNTTMAYAYVAASQSYTLHTTNSGGSGKVYCYNSVSGGSVSTVALMTTAC